MNRNDRDFLKFLEEITGAPTRAPLPLDGDPQAEAAMQHAEWVRQIKSGKWVMQMPDPKPNVSH